MTDIRYYKGILKIKILEILGRKAYIEYLEPGRVGGNMYPKIVMPGSKDVVLIRHCWRNRK